MRRLGYPSTRLCVVVVGLLMQGVCLSSVSGQDSAYPIRFRHLTIDDGLSQQDVHVILQDTLGFLWFGTEDGLNRYDGHTLRVFRPTPFDTTSLGGHGSLDWRTTEGAASG